MNTRNVIITKENKYLSKKEALKVADIIYTKYQSPVTIEILGKNKYAIKFDEREIDIKKMKKMENDIDIISAKMYIENEKHLQRKLRASKKNERMKEADEINHLMIQAIEEKQLQIQ